MGDRARSKGDVTGRSKIYMVQSIQLDLEEWDGNKFSEVVQMLKQLVKLT